MKQYNARRMYSMPIMLYLILLGLLGTLFLPPVVWPQGKGGVLRIGMTAADIANTAGIPDQGFEGYRFVGYQLYDALVRWDLSQGERLLDIAPALAESWEVDKNDVQRWVFKLRHGVKFHDGSDFNADAVIWNWDKIRNKEVPQYDTKQAGEVAHALQRSRAIRKSTITPSILPPPSPQALCSSNSSTSSTAARRSGTKSARTGVPLPPTPRALAIQDNPPGTARAC